MYREGFEVLEHERRDDRGGEYYSLLYTGSRRNEGEGSTCVEIWQRQKTAGWSPIPRQTVILTTGGSERSRTEAAEDLMREAWLVNDERDETKLSRES